MITSVLDKVANKGSGFLANMLKNKTKIIFYEHILQRDAKSLCNSGIAKISVFRYTMDSFKMRVKLTYIKKMEA